MQNVSGHRWNIIPKAGFNDRENYFTVNCCGYEKYVTKNVKTLREKGRLDYQLLYMVKGTGRFLVGDSMKDIPCGNLILFHPGETQRYEYHCINKPELYWIHFTGFGTQDYLSRIGLFNERQHFIGIQNGCIEYFKKIMLELQLKAPLYRQTADAALLELLATIGRHKIYTEKQDVRSVDGDIQNIMEQMHEGYGKQWNINDMARQCLLSPNRFMHKFKAQTGLPAMAYLLKIRMDKARDLLINSSLSINEISNLIGYENPLYFSRFFSKSQGVCPREFRRKR